MNDFVLMLVMFGIFFAAVYGGHAYVQRLRQRGEGERIEALHDATLQVQGRIRRLAGAFFRSRNTKRN